MSGVKEQWPEVVGWPAAQAVSQINSDRPDVSVEVLPDYTTNVAPGYKATRVRVYFGSDGNVDYTPVVG